MKLVGVFHVGWIHLSVSRGDSIKASLFPPADKLPDGVRYS